MSSNPHIATAVQNILQLNIKIIFICSCQLDVASEQN